MKATAEVVVIGGGVIGTSLLFSLGRLGVTDTLLVEKDVLGSGSGPLSDHVSDALFQPGDGRHGLEEPRHLHPF